LLFWDSSRYFFTKTIKQLDGEDVELEFEVSKDMTLYITAGEI